MNEIDYKEYQYMLQERAGILEFDAGISRERSIIQAKEIVDEWIKSNNIITVGFTV